MEARCREGWNFPRPTRGPHGYLAFPNISYDEKESLSMTAQHPWVVLTGGNDRAHHTMHVSQIQAAGYSPEDELSYQPQHRSHRAEVRKYPRWLGLLTLSSTGKRKEKEAVNDIAVMARAATMSSLGLLSLVLCDCKRPCMHDLLSDICQMKQGFKFLLRPYCLRQTSNK